ncbi:MAG: M56 family metallopeptidase [Muribaculaceae bacterium]|nr:M56 family metallopeptidase [Muribaculaceae bacterium]
MLARSIIAIIATARIIGNGEKIKCEQGFILVKSNQVQSPFNWMTFIVMPNDLQESGINAIMTHELAHLKKRHSLDLILAEVVLALQWFNPAAWMLRADLQAVHEFEADDAVVQSCGNYKEYEEILIGQVTAMSAGLLANGFTEQTLKQRIIMLHKKKSSRKRVLKALYLVAIIAASMVANATTVYTTEEEPQVKKTTEIVSANPSGKVDVTKDRSVEYYLDGERIDGPDAVASSQVKSMEIDKSGKAVKVKMYTTEQPGAKKVTRFQTSTTFTDDEGNTTTVSDQGIKYGYEFYVDGVKKASIADIASDAIESIEVDKKDPDHPKVYVKLKK